MNHSTHYNFNKPELNDAPDITKVSDAIEAIDGVLYDKVDKETGKGLSSNDYTDTDKTAVGTISDKVDKETGKGLSTNDYTTAEKNKVADYIGAAVSKTSDFKVTKTSGNSTCAVNSVRKSGNMMMVSLKFTTTATYSTNKSNLFTGTIGSKTTGVSYNPAQTTTGIGYIGNIGIVGQITASGDLYIRPLGALASGDDIYVYWTYFM